MAKISLKLCMGTMCYVMGGSALKDVVETLPKEIKKHLEVSFSPCLGCCNEKPDAPYVEMNGKIISGVTKSYLTQLLKEEVQNVI